MGLDSVEFIMAVETSFGIAIPDADAETLQTPRELIHYLSRHLPVSDSAQTTCLSQRAFYRVRRACTSRFGRSRRELAPRTHIADLLPGQNRSRHWKGLHADLQVEVWPPHLGPLGRRFFASVSTLGELANSLATQNAVAFRDAGQPWSPSQIERTVVDLIETELGVDMRRFTLDSSFVLDMGVD